jgi:hypothetical protein
LVSFVAENQYFEDAMIKPENMGIQTVSIKEDSSFPMSRIFDGNTSTYAWFFYSQGYFWDFRISPYITTATIYIKNGDYNVKIKFSEDDGQTWASTVVPSSFDGIWALDRVYNINRIYLTNYVNYARIYELRFYEAGAIKKHKLTNGEIYEYDPVAAQWNKTYKLPIGYFSLWRNPEGTSWEVGPFIPTHIPQMAIAPFFRKTSGGLAL